MRWSLLTEPLDDLLLPVDSLDLVLNLALGELDLGTILSATASDFVVIVGEAAPSVTGFSFTTTLFTFGEGEDAAVSSVLDVCVIGCGVILSSGDC
mmetsp:Transcript_27091/g.45754  ORF Transcript_27091/g.45754 Transcript_27091/m.45754 type:complete len:96 (-) Transcript_27091:400-687(-)